MPLTSGDHLRKFLRAWMKQNKLTAVAVEKISGGEITDGYVSKILSGRAKYPSVDKVQALAKGIGIDEEELFAVARGLRDPAAGAKQSNQWNALGFIKAMQEIILDADLTRIVQGTLRISGKDRREILQLIEQRQKPKTTKSRGQVRSRAKTERRKNVK